MTNQNPGKQTQHQDSSHSGSSAHGGKSEQPAMAGSQNHKNDQ